ncbi:site-specific integrase [Microbacterium limosum]|uniref:Site-specific integrase n=1 Tax=Microbacterium limosum TaxID=3079935 RepID=A0AAU0ME66_9MICO|nr:site-specific integrase [Microbacterium sp. Y20]WOQ68624.1 site-specific integrase [Microbacterium sp. Y20]
MARPRTPLGTFGQIRFESKENGQIRAVARFRDNDGRLRKVSATADTQKAAENKLKTILAVRAEAAIGQGELTADSSFRQLVEVWLADLDLDGVISSRTRTLYEWNMRNLVLPALENYALREISVRMIDQLVKTLKATKSYSSAKQARTVLSLAFGLAVRYDAMRSNPVRDIARLRKPASQAMALRIEQVEAIRSAVSSWRRDPGHSGPPPDGQLEQIIEVMLGTSARIGEVLAIRKCDVNVTVTPATVRICGTIISEKGTPTHRQDHPKTAKSTRVVAVPGFAAEALRVRLVATSGADAEHLLFFTRNGTPFTTNNVRRRLGTALSAAGIEGVTPHAFRRTVATVLDRASGPELAAEMLGHTSSKITLQHYIEPDEAVNPVTADILESLAPRRKDDG